MNAAPTTAQSLPLAARRLKMPADTYEGREAYNQTKQADLAAVGQYVQEIAQALNLSFEQRRDIYGSRPTDLLPDFYLRDKETCLYVQLVTYPASKAEQLHVSSSYPRNLRGDLPSRAAVTFDDSINIGASRTPEQAAKDIQNRFLPYHRAAYAAYLGAIERDAKQAGVVTANLEKLLTAAGPRAKARHGNSPKQSEQGFYHAHGDARVTESTVHFERMSLPVELAAKVLELLRDNTPVK